MNKNNKKSLKGGMTFDQSQNNYDPFSVPTVSVSNNFNKANALLEPTTRGVQQGISTATEEVSNNFNKANALLEPTEEVSTVSDPTKSESDGAVTEAVNELTDGFAKLETTLVTAEAKVATTTAVAIADAVGNTIKTQGPKLLDNVKKGAEYLYEVVNTIKEAKFKANAEADTAALKINEAAKNEQIKILMISGLTKEQAEAEFDILEKERNEKEKVAAAAEVEVAKADASIDAALEIAKATGAAAAAGGSRKKSITLGQIQKGGRQSAKRTKKSINDFFNSSVTSSQILKMITNTNTNRNTKVKRKRKRISRRSRK